MVLFNSVKDILPECPQAGGGGGSGPLTSQIWGRGTFLEGLSTIGSRRWWKSYLPRDKQKTKKTSFLVLIFNEEEGNIARDFPQGGSIGGSNCYDCNEADHTSKGCPNLFSELTEDGKPHEQYIPEAVTCDERNCLRALSLWERFNNFDKVVLHATGKDILEYITSFEEAGLHQLLLQNIKNSGYIKPTPVQKASVVVILAKKEV
ncbi:probable ATP-dependent RNA helicase vasa-like [Daphnia carinata]|uniref:probable ATP-dependent RNA helicase vasa-like n=1 Tax=Daphnia carinata TaxID=120202 RepID=UPI002868A42B|nr:probable ATP-dependent RNA helicase vasa-like [Daphnia carinata]